MADPDQTASEEAVWSGFSLLTITSEEVWQAFLECGTPILKTKILCENRKRKVFKILGHLPYMYIGCS